MRVLRWAGPAVLLVEVVLVAGGVLSLGSAALLFVLVEGLLALTVAGQLVAARRRYRQARTAGAEAEAALGEALRTVLPGPVAAAVHHELRLWASLVLLARRRRHGVPPGAVAIPYHRDLRPMAVTFLALTVVEVAVVELAVPWTTVRWVLLVAGVWTLLFVAGMAAANVVRPHVVTWEVLRLRAATFADVRVPLDRVASVAVRRRPAPDRTISVADDELVLGVSGSTGVEVRLTGPTTIGLGRRSATVTAVRFAADDPAAAVRALRAAADLRDPR
ncbi:hypothetical protein [Modestobacter sp. VKM Ac-2984]|uniref:hypothetical protein n=1 Tax=Modestobacter sp. VKM Ac-2984 TaxID=3004138 RepID=UPI0022AACD8B|nr:hypothetical protein [Modestobacter sp. VKM Ac-2984]MCZ2814872.1 hypothetical protein [Modestobacter sp. VKM Ac-2984]